MVGFECERSDFGVQPRALSGQGHRVKSTASAIRFAVVDDQGRLLSSVWRVWSHNRDVYSAVRNIAGKFKTSLHASGCSRHAFVTDEVAQRFQKAGRDRATLKWRRPNQQVPGGTLLLQIIIPEPGLAPSFPGYKIPSAMIHLKPPPANHAIYVSVVETAAGAVTHGPRFADRPTETLASWRMPEGTTLWVVAHDALLSEGNLKALDHAKQLVTTAVNPAVLPAGSDSQPSDLRGFLVLATGDGVGRLIDLSMEFVRHMHDSSGPA
jgi:hypothetical protein